MFPIFGHVPVYPAVFVVFWGAAAVFVLAMARHLRVFVAANPVQSQPRPLGDIPRRFVGLVEFALVQTKMFKDWRAGLMHGGIFWGFVLLTIGTANIVTGGVIQAVLSIPFDGLIWTAVAAMQNVVAVIVLVSKTGGKSGEWHRPVETGSAPAPRHRPGARSAGRIGGKRRGPIG